MAAPILKDAQGEISSGFKPDRIQAIIQAAHAGNTAKTANAGNAANTVNAVKAGVEQQATRMGR
ncbi:hypothetical protein V5R04_00390 [Jonesiaceae bacterium BS-20]|uniref:Uncharacterized protein n=1 Tax=Jonesiaceae bacterium BS-20 TaxID=3120821 RepID=A0AAU7DYA6_9MICO